MDLSTSCYPGHQSFFLTPGERIGNGSLRLIETSPIPETEQEKPLAVRVQVVEYPVIIHLTLFINSPVGIYVTSGNE